jgi:phage terminase large subunit-like protein
MPIGTQRQLRPKRNRQCVDLRQVQRHRRAEHQERHQRDRARGRWIWSPAHAERVCLFIERLVHIKGEWARRPAAARYIQLQPWECFIVASIFGWLRHDGTRRYRIVYLEIPRKNGKSILVACIGLYMLVADGEEGAEVYCGATTEQQAWEVFGPARMMALRSPGFADHWHVQIGAQHLGIVDSAARMAPIIGSPHDGASPSCALADELHEHITNELWDTMLTGMGADGARAMKTMRDAGSWNVCQDEASCVVFGMPREAYQRGGAEQLVPLEEIAKTVLDLLEK